MLSVEQRSDIHSSFVDADGNGKVTVRNYYRCNSLHT